MESILKKLLLACTLCLLAIHLGQSIPLRDKTCMCYYHFYNCDTYCAARYKTDHNRNLCWSTCVLNYTRCVSRCTGEDVFVDVPDNGHQYIDESGIF